VPRNRTLTHIRTSTRRIQEGFSLPEFLIASVVLLVVAGATMSGIGQTVKTHGTITNRTDMHSSVRNATELLQQEIGQAGKNSLPAAVTLSAAIVANPTTAQPVGVSSAANMFVGEQMLIDVGQTDANDPATKREETVTLTAVNLSTNQITAIFNLDHATGAPVRAAGAFNSGVVPTSTTNGSTATVLKLFGDVNDDGNMQYVEYTCNTTAGNLYRNAMSITAGVKPMLTPANVLLPNIRPNPDGTSCFTYQQKVVGLNTYVINVAVTMTVQTEARDAQTGQFQTETKALLNVSPRNVFQVWQMASGGYSNRVQPTPASVTALLP
jgi:prepilin-type N-terminal cleavage/methylation domain-containing protein